MSGSPVVLRCPNCGTTQGHQGECEACHEAEVRWFCPNHSPGRWLDGPACAECGARVGVPGRAPAPPGRPAPAAPGASREPPRSTTPPSRAPTWDAPLEGPVRGPGAGGEPEPEITSWPFGIPRRRRGHTARRPFGIGEPPDVFGPGGSRRADDPPGPGAPGGEPPFVTVDPADLASAAARSAFGCIGRLVMLFIVLAVLAFLMLGGFLGGLFGAEADASAGSSTVASAVSSSDASAVAAADTAAATCSWSAESPAACGGSAAPSP